MGCEDLMAYCTRKWLSDILLRNYDSVCAMTLALLLVIGGVEKSDNVTKHLYVFNAREESRSSRSTK